MSWWREVVESYACPTCGADAQEPCRTHTGAVADAPHASRCRVPGRCKVCGSRKPADASESELCDRCMLVRSLEVERATTWKRLHP